MDEHTHEQKITAALIAVRQVYDEPGWLEWSEKWLSGQDRSLSRVRTLAAQGVSEPR